MYRVLAAADECGSAATRCGIRRMAPRARRDGTQSGPWDITKLKGPVPYLYYSLYVILDPVQPLRTWAWWRSPILDRADLAIQPQQLTIHADRGAPMRTSSSRCCSPTSASRPATGEQ